MDTSGVNEKMVLGIKVSGIAENITAWRGRTCLNELRSRKPSCAYGARSDGGLKLGAVRAVFFLLFLILFCIPESLAQAPTQRPGSEDALSTDPLERDTPRKALLGFVQAAQSGNFKHAAKYLQVKSRRAPGEAEEALAQQLKVLLDRNYEGNLNLVSNDPAGQLNDGLPPDIEKAGGIVIEDQKVSLNLIRVEDREAGKIWLISGETLKQVPDLYSLVRVPDFLGELPDVLVDWKLLAMPLWQWVAFVLLYPVALGAAWLQILVLRLIYQLIARLRTRWNQKEIEAQSVVIRPGPFTLFLMLLLHYEFVNAIGVPLLYRQFYNQVVGIPIAIVVYWLLARLIDLTTAKLGEHLLESKLAAAGSLLMLGRRAFKALTLIVIVLLVLQSFGVNVTAGVAGIGIGGLALGLGAQKTLENLFGGISVLSDRALRIGDACKVGDQAGTVEDIGLRSTRIRRLDRTLVSIPNGYLATANLENYGRRDKFLFNPVIALRYETSADQLRYVLAEIRQMLYAHPMVEASTARARLTLLGAYSIDLEVIGYITAADYSAFLAIQEDLLLRIMDLVAVSGTRFAYPSQTLYVGKDQGLDAGKKESAAAAVERWRQSNQLPFPDHDPEVVEQLRGTLEYPPPGSVARRQE
jgi:MscS family membrane protein